MFVRALSFRSSGFEDGTEPSSSVREKNGLPDAEGASAVGVNGGVGAQSAESLGEHEVGNSTTENPGGGSGAEGVDPSADPYALISGELAEAKEKLAETHDRMLRIAADFDNARKRWDREREEVRKYSIADFARELLPVIDAFDKAMMAIEKAEFKGDTEEINGLSAIIEGVQLVQKVFHESIKKHGIERLPGKGEPFNPEFHNAIARDVDQDIERDTVAEEFVSGYRIGDRVLRTAMVKVLTRD
jgi:molecular chaperone GrpE